jgi:hypothetical protein
VIEAVVCAWDLPDGAAFYASVDDGASCIKREYTIPGTLNQAEIDAARFVVAAIPYGSSQALRLTTDSHYLHGLLSRTGKEWTKPIHANIASITALRTALARIQFEVRRDDRVAHVGH